jgi:peptidoglycan-associated lipoprotein
MSGRAIVIASSLLLLMATGCAKQPSSLDASASAMPSATRDGMGGGTMGDQYGRPEPKDYVPVSDVPNVHFDFDRYSLRPADMKVLDGNAAWMKSHPQALLMIEGHCDERGTGEYNFALGERRAKTTMDYLVSRGVDARRIAVVSFGEERPVCRDHKEGCWAKNRRADFLVKAD